MTTGRTDAESYLAEAVRAAGTVNGMPAGVRPFPIRGVGIIGAGTMGGGIAMNFANAGIPVHIVEDGQEALDRGLRTVRGHYERSASRGRFPAAEVDVRMDRISSSLEVADLADCDLVIEAVFEDMALKKRIFSRLDAVAKPGAILATNTSGLDVDAIAAATSRPEAVIGLHFFSPANVMKLLEIVRGARTADAVLATALEMAGTIGKIAVVVGVCPGFVGNRMLYPRQQQAQSLLRQGVMPWDVDRALKAFGFKMGPFEMSDLAGLDIGWSKGAKTASPLRDALCESGRRGQKTGAGYYDYDENRTPLPSPAVAGLIRSTFGTDGTAAVITDEKIVETCLFPLVNEGARIIEDGKAQRPSDIDVVWVYGYNWPQRTGGPMRWADGVGLGRITRKLAELGETDERVRPAALLERLTREGKHFADL